MAAKSFEEQVREELEVVRLQPDASVWENVNAALTRRRRRFGIFWLLPALVAAGIVWGIIEWKKPSSTPVIVTHQQTNPENKKTGEYRFRQKKFTLIRKYALTLI